MASSTKSFDLLIATGNPGKFAEISELAAGLSVRFKNLKSFPDIIEIEENGKTFEANAILKAEGYAAQTGIITLADDSGLEIEALENRPGVQSARYAGAETSFDQKIAMLLKELEKTGDVERRARFVCVMALANKKGETIFTAEGICTGTIARAPRGNSGFGYDPIFVPDGFTQTFGELSVAIKQQISHRGRAFLKIANKLRALT